MNISDPIIIYVTLGSPFAVNRLLNEDRKSILQNIAGIFFAFIAWPIMAMKLLLSCSRDSIRKAPGTGDRASDNELLQLRNAIESRMSVDRHILRTFEFRQAFDRFTGLALASMSASRDQPVYEIFDVAGRTDPQIGAVCLERKERRKLALHLEQARNEFFRIVYESAAASGGSNEIVELALRTADLVGDVNGAVCFRNIPLLPRFQAINTAETSHELWNLAS